jgi:hypothetical protein
MLHYTLAYMNIEKNALRRTFDLYIYFFFICLIACAKHNLNFTFFFKLVISSTTKIYVYL